LTALDFSYILLIIRTIITWGSTIKEKGKYKRSQQREQILGLLQNTGKHPSADWIYSHLKDDFPNLSMGTVYRNLNILIEQGLVKKIDFGSTFDRFEANIAPHYHFICESCGSIIDLDLPIDESLNEHVQNETPYLVSRHKIEYFGICDRCRVSG